MFDFSKNTQFSRLPQDEDRESLVAESDRNRGEQRKAELALSPIFSSFLLLAIIVSSGLLGIWFGSQEFTNKDKVCVKHILQYSPPILEDLDVTFSTVRFNGSLMHENIYRQTGSPEVDEAWEDLDRSVIIPTSLGQTTGFLPSMVQVQDKYDGGFPANVEGLHHLHCLNLLRQTLWFNYDYYHALGEGAFKNSDEIVRYHVTHCLDILRQNLMCNVDIGMLGQIWWNKDGPLPYPDFDTKHKCRNFDAIRQWAFEHQASEDVPKDYLKIPKEEDVLEAIP